MPLSYAQNLEDFHLSLAFAGQEVGFYIDIGGGHPVADNVSQWFYERGWRGIVVEPQAELAKLYARLRPRDLCLQTLVGRQNGTTDFFAVDRFHGLSTTVPAFAEGAGQLGTSFQTTQMPMMTLASLFESHVTGPVDFLKIDVEGAEADVLAGNDWQRFRPKVIVAEAVTPLKGEPAWDGWEPQLLANGYDFILFDTLNRFYVAKECPDIKARMPRERAPWDSARHMYEIGRAPENASHPDHALALELARGFYARLPHLSLEHIADLLLQARQKPADPEEKAALLKQLNTDAFRACLGRIACGYDGGQIIEEAK